MADAAAGQANSADLPKLKVFISYSRKDGQFAEELSSALEACGFDPFLDKQDIAAAEDWEARLTSLILQADTVVFVLSPDAVASERCAWEVEETARLSKRIIPLVWRPVEEATVPERLRRLNYIFFDKPHGFGAALAQLVRALNVDLGWIREHTRLGEMAARWQARNKADALLIRGDDLEEARTWLAHHPDAAPEPTIRHREFLAASEKAEAERIGKEKATLDTIAAEQSARARFQRRSYWLLTALWVAGAGIFVVVLLQSVDAFRRQSKVMAGLAQRALDEGFYDRALRIAMFGLPEYGSVPWKPWSPEAEAKLSGAALLSQFRTRLPHEFFVNRAVFSPDGQSIATSTVDSIRIWNVDTGELKRQLGTRVGLLSSGAAAFSADGRRLVNALNDRTALIWDLETGTNTAQLRGHGGDVTSTVFAPDGQRVLTASADKTARLWNAQTGAGTLVLRGHTERVNSAAFSPNGSRIVTASNDNTARIFDAVSGSELFVLKGHENSVNGATFSFDGRRVVTSSLDKTARLWDAETGRDIAVLRDHEDPLGSAAFSSDGQLIVTSSLDTTARVWNGATGAPVAVLRGHGKIVTSAVFSPDGRRVLTASYDETARLWEVEGGALLAVLKGHEDRLNLAAFSPDGRRVVTASDDKTARIYDSEGVTTATSLKVQSPAMRTVSLSPDGRRLVATTEENGARVWDVEGTKSVPLTGHGDLVRSATFSPDGGRVVTTSDDMTARVWNADTGAEIVRLQGHSAGIGHAAFSADGERVVTASDDKTARIWNLATGKVLASLEGHENVVNSAVFSPDGQRVVTASSDETAIVWRVDSGARIAALEGHKETVTAASFSPDSRSVVTASRDNTARVWSSDGRELAQLKGDDWIVSAAFSPDGASIVTVSVDDTARLWDARSGARIATLTNLDTNFITKTPTTDGQRWVVLSQEGTVRVWNLNLGKLERGQKLKDAVCKDKLLGAQTFTTRDAEDLVLQGLEGTNVCTKYGPLSVDYWRSLWPAKKAEPSAAVAK